MPFQQGTRLPGERASKLGHLNVLESELVKKLIEQFEYPAPVDSDPSNTIWHEVATPTNPLRLIFAVDGSLQVIKSDTPPVRELAFVKTAVLRLDPHVVAQLDPDYPHPMALKKMMQDSALYHSTVFPLKNATIPGRNYTEAMCRIVYDSLRDPRLNAKPYETLKWLVYKKWNDTTKSPSPNFQCPYCDEEIQGLPFDSNTGKCSECQHDLYVSDVLGLHMEMQEDSASMSFASNYMLIHEMLMLFSGIQHYWDNNRKILPEALFIKDGPLSLRGQYSKLVPLIREFFKFSHDQGINVHVIGQEKSGKFFDHLLGIERFAKPKKASEPGAYAILSHEYIRKEIQRTSGRTYEYGAKTNYGEKLFLKPTHLHSMVLSIPVIEYKAEGDYPTSIQDYIGFDRIMATIPTILSHRFQGALLPVELANGVASLSSYPSATVLKVFAGLSKK